MNGKNIYKLLTIQKLHCSCGEQPHNKTSITRNIADNKLANIHKLSEKRCQIINHIMNSPMMVKNNIPESINQYSDTK